MTKVTLWHGDKITRTWIGKENYVGITAPGIIFTDIKMDRQVFLSSGCKFMVEVLDEDEQVKKA